ncbi:MAG TPA: hypothetical protein VGE74_12065 [Gemmata sp.]
MSPQYINFVLPPAVAVAVAAGAVAVWVGFRTPRKSPEGVPVGLRDRLTVQRGGLFRVAGSLLLVGALVWFVTVPAPDGWVRRATADGVCSIEFPREPVREVNPDGEGADRLVVALPDRNANFSLTFSEVSAETAALPSEKQFELLRELFGSKKTPGGDEPKLVTERAFTEGGLPGREYLFAIGHQLVTRIKVLIRENRIYRPIAVNAPGGQPDRDAQRFIDSFRIEAPRL